MTPHIKNADLALFATGDLSLWRRITVRLHISRCAVCRHRAAQFEADQDALLALASEMPEGVNWDALSAEMTANIHLGLAAGECVAPRTRRTISPFRAGLRPAVFASLATVCLVALVCGAWWLNTPPEDKQTLARAMSAIVHGRPAVAYEKDPLVEASPKGIEVRENGASLGVSQDAARLTTVSVSTQGSASAHYVDQDTGQVTVTSVYVQ